MTDDENDNTEDYIPVTEAARVLGLPVRTVVRWADAGRIPSVVVEGKTLVSLGDVKARVVRVEPEEEKEMETSSDRFHAGPASRAPIFVR